MSIITKRYLNQSWSSCYFCNVLIYWVQYVYTMYFGGIHFFLLQLFLDPLHGPLPISCPLPYCSNLQYPVSTAHLCTSVGPSNGTWRTFQGPHLWREMTLPRSHQLPIAASLFPHMLGCCLAQSCAGNHSHCEFLTVLVLLRAQDLRLLQFFHSVPRIVYVCARGRECTCVCACACACACACVCSK